MHDLWGMCGGGGPGGGADGIPSLMDSFKKVGGGVSLLGMKGRFQ